MSLPISAITSPRAIEPIQTNGATTSGGFQQVLQSAIQGVERSAGASDAAVQQFVSGSAPELHSAVLATQNAELDLEMFLQMRNKVVSAYEEIMKMQV